MPAQKTPPLGWPHTEAQKYAVQETREILEHAEKRGVAPAKPKKRSGCGCLAGVTVVLIGLAILGAALALLMPAFTQTTSAEDVFTDMHPGWEVESADEPEGSGGAVRIVAWDYTRDIGRIAMMEPVSYDPGYEERPLLLGRDDDASAERLIDAFARSYGDLDWSYVVEAQFTGTAGEEESWIVRYQVFDAETQEWSGILTTSAGRNPGTGEWSVTFRPADTEG